MENPYSRVTALPEDIIISTKTIDDDMIGFIRLTRFTWFNHEYVITLVRK